MKKNLNSPPGEIEPVAAPIPAAEIEEAEPLESEEGPVDPASAEVAIGVDREAEGAVQATPSFPVVGIGASAGGLAAIEEFLAAMPAKAQMGMAFVLVQHLDPDHKSILVDLVRKYTTMPVDVVEDGMIIHPDHVYIIPPNRDMALLHGKLHLFEPAAPRGLRLPIDYFFRSLAQDLQERAICIVLSGTGTDGTLGLRTIKGAGGMAMVQDPQSARYDGMPRSALSTGMVDFMLAAAKMPAQLLTFASRARGALVPLPPDVETKVTDLYRKIFILLRAQTGHDFSFYKQNTIHRRIERRMTINQIDHLADYVRYLQQSPVEIDTLFRELLIGVTNFFRDTDGFAVLQSQAITQIFQDRPAGVPVRVWVAGCSTGEEAFSIAILMREEMSRLQKEYKVQIFATDIDDVAIEKARQAVYPDSIAGDVSVERLAEFFSRNGNAYRLGKEIREMVIFAEQNLTADPPFSRLDLISCRNLLIYMGNELQKRVLPIFHYALNPEGWLFLGNSESIGDYLDIFEAVDRKWKLYRSKVGPSRLREAKVDFFQAAIMPAFGDGEKMATAQNAGKMELAEVKVDLRAVVERAILAEFSPTSLIINGKGDILFIHGRTGRYLEAAPGEPSLNIIRMARNGLRMELTAALHRILIQREAVRCPGLRILGEGPTTIVDLTLTPLTKPDVLSGLFLVVLQDVTPTVQALALDDESGSTDMRQRVAELEYELRTKEEYLQTAIEELETSNEELKSANEELQSANEELQSTNEELETSKEELQSVNEELMTVNTELQEKMSALSQANDDLNNLMSGTGVGTVFVDYDLKIQRFTPLVTEVINLISTDVGRPVHHIVTNLLDYDRLVPDIQSVLRTLQPKEVTVATQDGHWYLMRILPYRTLNNVINGVVITFVEITQQKKIQEQLEQLSADLEDARDLAESVIETVRTPLLVLDDRFCVVSANQAFYTCFPTQDKMVKGRTIFELNRGQWDIPELRQLLGDILPKQQVLHDYGLTLVSTESERRTFLINAREIRQQTGKERLILLGLETK